jgi:hypothetical protein
MAYLPESRMRPIVLLHDPGIKLQNHSFNNLFHLRELWNTLRTALVRDVGTRVVFKTVLLPC